MTASLDINVQHRNGDPMRYFAYGTLLDIDYMRRLCPSARSLGVRRLEGYEIGFAKYADPEKAGCTLVAAPDAAMWGVEYELSEEDMAKLDLASGVPTGDWAQKRVTVRDADDKSIETTTYVIPQPSGSHAPPDSYVAPIYKGAAALEFPADYVQRLRDLIGAAQVARP